MVVKIPKSNGATKTLSANDFLKSKSGKKSKKLNSAVSGSDKFNLNDHTNSSESESDLIKIIILAVGSEAEVELKRGAFFGYTQRYNAGMIKRGKMSVVRRDSTTDKIKEWERRDVEGRINSPK